MANLKDLLVTGVARIVGKVYSSGGFVGNLEGTASNASKVNNLTVETAVPANAKFTDTTYSSATTSASGLMSSTDKSKLDGIASGATANTGTLTFGKYSFNGSADVTIDVFNGDIK